MAITKELAIASIVITPATGAVRVEQVQRVLEDRASQVSADRLVIAAQRDHIRKQKPELAVFGGGNG